MPKRRRSAVFCVPDNGHLFSHRGNRRRAKTRERPASAKWRRPLTAGVGGDFVLPLSALVKRRDDG